MAAKRINLNQRCCFALSGITNPLGKTLAVEMCRRFKPGSVALLIDVSSDMLQEVKKEIQYLETNIEVICCNIGDWQLATTELFDKMLMIALKTVNLDFDLTFILHNEGEGSTGRLIEPQDEKTWQQYVQANLNAVVALDQAFLQCFQLANVEEKLVVNITSTIPQLKPFVYNTMICSCQQARDMYFRSMADLESAYVMGYSPGLMETHIPDVDINNNIVKLNDLMHSDFEKMLLKFPRVQPLQSTMALINILEEMSFISGHDVDYYDTFVL